MPWRFKMGADTRGSIQLGDMMRITIRDLALYSLLGTILYAAKIVMAPLPNIEPVSLFTILLAVCCGWKGLCAVYLYVFLELTTWGIGLWSAAYLYVWLILFFAAMLLKQMKSSFGWALLAGAFGLLFGLFSAPVYWAAGGWSAAVGWWISGIPMDLLHGAANFCITWILFKPLSNCLNRLMRWWQVQEKA